MKPRSQERFSTLEFVPVYDFEEHDGSLSFTMREVEGITLQEVIEQTHQEDSRWRLADLCLYFTDMRNHGICASKRGCASRHQAREHHDWRAHDEVLIMDWGIARLTPGSELHKQFAGTMKERPGVVAGTLMYMSPEQAKGQLHLLQPQSDVYTLD